MGPLMAEGLNGIAVQGIVSRSVRDSATMMDVLQGPEPHAPYFMPAPTTPYAEVIKAPPRTLRIGFTTASPIGTPVDAEAIRAVEHAARLLEALGHHVEEVTSPVNGLQLAYSRFPQATYAIWYPVIERAALEAFISALVATGIKDMLRIEYCPLPDSSGFGMTGSGMLVVNPPYTLAKNMQQALEELSPLLSATGEFQVHQLVTE